MAYYNSPKKIIYDWAHDTKGNIERTLVVLNEALEPVEYITDLWQKDATYIESQKNLNLYYINFYNFDRQLIDEILKYVNSDFFRQNLEEFQAKGFSYFKIFKILIEKFIQIGNFKIQNEEIAALLDLLMKYYSLVMVTKNIQKNIIITNYFPIFAKSRILNEIRKRNVVYSKAIGKYENVTPILGLNGELLQTGEQNAISYVLNMDELRGEYENLKINLELQQEQFKLNKR